MPELSYNAGNTLNRLGRYDRAVVETQRGLPPQDTQLGATTYFALGNHLVALEQYEQAYDAYKNALLLKPDDEDAKWNLELVLAQLRRQQPNQQGGQGPGQTPQSQGNEGPTQQGQSQGQPQPAAGRAGPATARPGPAVRASRRSASAATAGGSRGAAHASEALKGLDKELVVRGGDQDPRPAAAHAGDAAGATHRRPARLPARTTSGGGIGEVGAPGGGAGPDYG